MDTTVDGIAVRTLTGGAIAAPIDVAVAFGSVWVANHHGRIARIDPESMAVQSTVAGGGGPGWIAVARDAVWISNQMGQGMTRVDPATNETAQAGDWATCGRPVVAFGSIWQPACDAHRIMRIDPAAKAAIDVAAPAELSIVLARKQLITAGPGGLAALDPRSGAFTPIGGPDPGWVMAFAFGTIWASDDQQVRRLDPADGHVVATLPIAECGAVAIRDGMAWLTSAAGLVEVDPTTNAIVRTLPLGHTVGIASDAKGLWVTSYDANQLIRIRP